MSLKELEEVFHGEWLKLSLATVQKLYESFPGRTEAVISVKTGQLHIK